LVDRSVHEREDGMGQKAKRKLASRLLDANGGSLAELLAKAASTLEEIREQVGQATQSTPFEFEVKPVGYHDHRPPLHATRFHQSVHLGVHRRYFAVPSPDPRFTLGRITGRYESDEKGYAAMVNQAGEHVEVWLVKARRAGARRETPGRLAGRLEETSGLMHATLHAPEDPNKSIGTMRVMPGRVGKVLRISTAIPGEPALSIDVTQVGGSPIFSDSALEACESIELELYQRHPLFKSQNDWLRSKLDDGTLKRCFSSFYKTGQGPKGWVGRREALFEVDAHLAGVLGGRPNVGWDADDRPLVVHTIKSNLAALPWTERTSYAEVIQEMASTVAGDLDWPEQVMADKLKHLLALGFEIKKGERKYIYKCVLKSTGIAASLLLNVGAFGAVLEISREEPEWHDTFVLEYVQVGASLAAGVQLLTINDGKGVSRTLYRSEHIPGRATILGIGNYHGGAFSGGPQAMILHCRGGVPPLKFDLTNLFEASTVDVGAGIDVATLAVGIVGKPPSSRPREPRAIHLSREYKCPQQQSERSVHFRSGDALLTEAGRQLLRVVCANELAIFANPNSQLTLLGHTDRVDVEERNMELSCLRAFNVLQAIRDILGDNFKIPEERVFIHWEGENEAKAAGERDEVPNLAHRRVQVILNNMLVASIAGG
jgi:outer membrane protein OmpA-like peptidoglycan-associated protein